MSRSARNTSRPDRLMLYAENEQLQEPIPFVTARRFWLLVYMLVCTTGLSMLTARFLIRPLVSRILRSRQDFQGHVRDQITKFIANVAKSITALPGRQITVDTTRHRLYVNTETQTDDNEPQSVLDEHESVPQVVMLSSIASNLGEFGADREEKAYTGLSQKLNDLKTYLYEFDSYTYKTSYGGFSGNESNVPGGEGIQKVKAEIRSVKGSLLNARTFHSIQRDE